MRKKVFLLYLLFFALSNLKAQDDSTVDIQTWFDIVGFMSLGKHSAVGGDIGVRGLISSRDWNQFYFRPTYRYALNGRTDFAGGAAIFYTANQQISDLIEYRIFQEVNAQWPTFDNFQFSHRVRFEQRFFDYRNLQTPYGDTDKFSARMRYQLTLESNDFTFMDQVMYSIGAVEYFQLHNANHESFINNLRLVGIIGHRLSLNFRYEIHYIFQKSRKYVEKGLRTSEHIIRLRIFHVPKILRKIEQ